MRVFKSKKVYGAGEELKLGGPGLSDLTDLMFLVAFRHERPEERRAVSEAGALGGEASHAAGETGRLISACAISDCYRLHVPSRGSVSGTEPCVLSWWFPELAAAVYQGSEAEPNQ